jgi:hypothetical protein
MRTKLVLLLASAGLAAACDIPSSAPIFQQTWVVPGDSIAVSVAQILPANVALNGAGTGFLVVVTPPGSFNSTLGTLCGQPACQSPGSVVAPVPAFTSSGAALTRTVAFPATVTSATVTSGTLSLDVANALGFDPLRPNGANPPYGTVSVTITNGAAVTTTTFSGATRTLANGALTNLSVPIPAGTYAGSFSVSVAFDVPAGGSATLAASNAITITPSVNTLTVSQATVLVQNETITTSPEGYDLEDVDFADDVQGGGIIVNVTNPFTASAALTVLLQAPAQNGQGAVAINKVLNIPAIPTSTSTISLTQLELRSLIGKTGVTLTVSGTANGTGAGNTVSIMPTQRMMLRTSMQLLINVGG